MEKRGKALGVLLVLLLAASISGCDKIGGKIDGKGKETTEFVRGPEGLVMSFVPNYPQDKFIVSKPKPGEEGEPISVLIEVRNKGTYPPQEDPGNEEHKRFSMGKIQLSGFDDNIIDMSGLTEENIKEIGDKIESSGSMDITNLKAETEINMALLADEGTFGGVTIDVIAGTTTLEVNDHARAIEAYKKAKQTEGKSQRLGEDDGTPILYLPAASSVNPLGGVDTAEFDGKIVADNILIDSYNPTILVTACYPYFTKSTPTVCIDPEPFDTRQEKVCAIGSQTVPAQGAPVAVTRIDQEAAAGKIQFKISIKNVGDGDVIWDKEGLGGNNAKLDFLLRRCSPLEKDYNLKSRLDRKDFDRVQLEKVQIGSVNLLGTGRCSPFADGTAGTTNLIRLFDGEGFVICTYNVPDTVQSAYTTPIDIELRYAYRSTISKPIQIKKLETVGG